MSAKVAAAFGATGITIRESFGAIEAFERTPDGVRMIWIKNGERGSAEVALEITAVGWVADAAGLSLANAG